MKAESGLHVAGTVLVGLLGGGFLLSGYFASASGPARPDGRIGMQEAPVQPEAVQAAAIDKKAKGGAGQVLPAAATAWVAETATRTAIPPVAVKAYGAATLALSEAEPDCGLGWTTLAGIGAVESQHGTIGDRQLRGDGTTSTPILGPALDGGEFSAVAATTRSTQWHGDPKWDHAVGPMQFIPSTWDRWGSDGDGDKVKDPNNIFDASYAAARYLCASGQDLTTADGWSTAVRSYNHSDVYVASVLDAANDYA